MPHKTKEKEKQKQKNDLGRVKVSFNTGSAIWAMKATNREKNRLS